MYLKSTVKSIFGHALYKHSAVNKYSPNDKASQYVKNINTVWQKIDWIKYFSELVPKKMENWHISLNKIKKKRWTGSTQDFDWKFI